MTHQELTDKLAKFWAGDLQNQVYLIHELRCKHPDQIKVITKNTEIEFGHIEFGDFNAEEQITAWKHWEEVTQIGYNGIWIPIENIVSIKYY